MIYKLKGQSNVYSLIRFSAVNSLRIFKPAFETGYKIRQNNNLICVRVLDFLNVGFKLVLNDGI